MNIQRIHKWVNAFLLVWSEKFIKITFHLTGHNHFIHIVQNHFLRQWSTGTQIGYWIQHFALRLKSRAGRAIRCGEIFFTSNGLRWRDGRERTGNRMVIQTRANSSSKYVVILLLFFLPKEKLRQFNWRGKGQRSGKSDNLFLFIYLKFYQLNSIVWGIF